MPSKSFASRGHAPNRAIEKTGIELQGDAEEVIVCAASKELHVEGPCTLRTHSGGRPIIVETVRAMINR